MDNGELSAASIRELGERFVLMLSGLAGGLAQADLETVERDLQGAIRPVLGVVVEAVVAARVAAGRPQRPRCPTCGQRMRLVERERVRSLVGLVGEYQIARPYYGCAACHQGTAPLDAALGLGPGSWSPSLSRVACRLGLEVSFPEAADALAETLGAPVTDEGIRRITEGIGAVAEAEAQAAVGRAMAGLEPLAAAAGPPAPETLAVAVDGVMVHEADGWHACKVGVVAALGPKLRRDRDSGREYLALGPAHSSAGLETAEPFWYRVYVEAVRCGLGRPPLARVVVLGDGAEWIWRGARTFLGVGAVEVIEIVDFFHAVEHLWGVANAVFGTGNARAATWAKRQKAALYTRGARPILAALARLRVAGEAAEVVRKARAYFRAHAQRMNYPASRGGEAEPRGFAPTPTGFVARQLPIGSGAVESACKTLIQAREKGAGMCWSQSGAQAVATLRALHRSGRWQQFWSTQPQRRRPPVFPHRQRPPAQRAA